MNDLHNGYLNLIIGPMFSGKSSKLIQYIRKYKTLGYNMLVIKPNIDTRYTDIDEICTHNYEKESCFVYKTDELNKIFMSEDYAMSQIIIIEEGQFFSDLYQIAQKIIDQDNKHLIITALNGDSNRELFGDIYKLLPLCDNIEFLKALCIQCKDGTEGIFSKRIINNKEQLMVGGSDMYQAVCRKHYFEQ
jgi:thymidine kinase